MTPIRWLITDDIPAGVQAYKYNPEFRTWLRAASAFCTKRLLAIENRSLLLVADRPSKTLRDRVDRFLRAPDVHLFYLHKEMMRAGGVLSGHTLEARQAAFFGLWRVVREGGSLPRELNPSKACGEPFNMCSQRKSSGRGWRTVYKFGIARCVRQQIVNDALMAASASQYRTQFMYTEGGRHEAIRAIETVVDSDPSLTHWAKLDLANCFDNINLSRAHEVLPVKRKVVQHTISINQQEAIDRRQLEHLQFERSKQILLDSLSGSDYWPSASSYPLTLPQGAATSPRVAYWLIERGLPPLNPAREFMYGDDLLILGQTTQEVSVRASMFRELFRRHAAGPLQLIGEVGELAGGVEFLGMHISRAEHHSLFTGKQATYAAVDLADGARERFLAKVRAKIQSGVASGDVALTEACRYIERFLNALPTGNRMPLVLAACAVARQCGGDPNAVMNVIAAI
ncbi:hypothetical protein Q3O98_12030 [Ralstonia pseudosolanacearum]|uniref:hypothetical protein n=1 Tax=Ralstonia pseudosolanacearum TaxID=1310165 RepID=UPI00267697ED|nr:hypothetical protein [Ralstonia pseudosolanacearum]MDO3621829.1 hypothetical protein [Ralstonia pseudosolanacearum]